ncbi:hypothetical protein DSM112329_02840 [Paraconexibacter sp. AEG42_29]|uniref:Uncharacterized protein n=1 Tax=Paraconexibacter sp. AEG42_29 TaxID=2997339 RepID=A0AAU7AWG2_9ACTN
MRRELAYKAIAEVYRDLDLDRGYWTAEKVADAERRMAIDDADRPDSTAIAGDFALRVLDKLGVVDVYEGPGDCHQRSYR